MRLWNRNEPVIGGRYYEYTDPAGNKFAVTGFDTDWNGFELKVRQSMKNNNVQVPDNLMDLIEDQICSRQPAGKCRYENKAGDIVAKTVHVFAHAVDAVAGAITGKSPNLEQKARGCSGCNRRRMAMNR